MVGDKEELGIAKIIIFSLFRSTSTSYNNSVRKLIRLQGNSASLKIGIYVCHMNHQRIQTRPLIPLNLNPL